MVVNDEIKAWFVDLLQWGKYAQAFPVESCLDMHNNNIVVQLGLRTLRVIPFSTFMGYYEEGRSPEESIEIFIIAEYDSKNPGASKDGGQ
jgi:hypothetical protein